LPIAIAIRDVTAIVTRILRAARVDLPLGDKF